MKYAIYDKAADAYLTKLEFEHDVPLLLQRLQTLGLICGYNEYITEATLLDTKEEAVAVVTRIESNKFMEKGRFVMHSFDDTLYGQYIISEAGNPTKVVNNITVDLSGTINVKYGTMISHWSTISLNDAIDRMNALQKAVSAIYTSWNNTFDIYNIINIMDEKEHTHYQFINVTAKGLEKYSKDEKESPLNKRIEELEKANYELGERVTERGIVANRLLDENNSLKAKVEAIEKEARDWKNLYENALEDQKKLNDANKATIAYLSVNKMAKDKELSDWKRRAEDAIRDYKNCNEALGEWKRKFRDEVKENHELRVARDCSAEIIYAIRNAVANGDTNAFDCIESRMRHDPDFKSDPFMAGVRENVKDICYHEKINITNNNLKNSKIARLTEERDKALEQKEFYKRQANSVYGFAMPIRCCGKQITADILSGKKIPVDKKKYDDLVEYVSNINLTYDNMFCMMDKPVYLSTITESLNDLTK